MNRRTRSTGQSKFSESAQRAKLVRSGPVTGEPALTARGLLVGRRRVREVAVVLAALLATSVGIASTTSVAAAAVTDEATTSGGAPASLTLVAQDSEGPIGSADSLRVVLSTPSAVAPGTQSPVPGETIADRAPWGGGL